MFLVLRLQWTNLGSISMIQRPKQWVKRKVRTSLANKLRKTSIKKHHDMLAKCVRLLDDNVADHHISSCCWKSKTIWPWNLASSSLFFRSRPKWMSRVPRNEKSIAGSFWSGAVVPTQSADFFNNGQETLEKMYDYKRLLCMRRTLKNHKSK